MVRVLLAVITLTVWPVSQSAFGATVAQGKVLFQTITQRYAKVQPLVWGLHTESPKLALFIPEAEWTQLSKENQLSLAQYLKDLLSVCRVTPERYLDVPRDAPNYDSVRDKVVNLCAECWMIGVGRLTLDEKGVLYERVVMQGNAKNAHAESSEQPVKSAEWAHRERGVASTDEQKTRLRKKRLTPMMPPVVQAQKAQPPAQIEQPQQEERTRRDPQEPLTPAQPQQFFTQQPRVVRHPVSQPRPSQNRYKRWAEKAKQEEAWTIARMYYEKSLALDPHNQAVQAALSQVKQRQQREEERVEAGRAGERSPPKARSRLEDLRIPYSSSAFLKKAELGDAYVVSLFLTAGMSPDVQDKMGWTALMLASINGSTPVVRVLLDRRANVNIKSIHGMTALIYAAWNGHLAVVQALLRNGADVQAKDKDGWNALRYAEDPLVFTNRRNHLAVAQLLRRAGTR